MTQRGNNKTATFRNPSDYEAFLLFLRLATDRYRLQLHAYALMSNHFHLMVTPDTPDQLSRAMQSLGRRYVRFFNDRYTRTGTLWEGRYRSAVVADERYWLSCMRYIEMNPVRGGLVKSPELYRWSSYRAHALGAADTLLTSHAVYDDLGKTVDRRQEVWRRVCGQTITSEQLDALRTAIRKGFVIGEPLLLELDAAS